MFFGSKDKLMDAIRRNDVSFLRGYLKKHLTKDLSWPEYSGPALNYAASCNKPDVIELLVTELGLDPNDNVGVTNAWTPLHHAKVRNAHKAAAKLLALGADPAVKNSGGENAVAYCQSDPVQELADPGFAEKKKARQQEKKEEQLRTQETRIKGGWSLTAPAEVVHERETPDGKQRLTDVFNFETRVWRAVVTDLEGKGMAQNIVFFDDMTDTTIARRALEKLKELGGEADESAVPETSVIKKIQKSPPTP